MKFLRRLRDEGPLPVTPDDGGLASGQQEEEASETAETEAALESARPAPDAPDAPDAPASPGPEAPEPESLGPEAPEPDAPGPDSAAAPPPSPSDVAEGDPHVDARDARRTSDVASAAGSVDADRAAGVNAVPDAAPGLPRLVLIADGASASSPDEGRPTELQLAGLHLRTGLHALARAELEALAGRGRLDEAALLDLAEVRWRTGDLAGAGEAANALLARGASSPLALVIAAEAISAAGRPGEARRLSTRAVEATDAALDAIFAGMPRAAIWPEPREAEPVATPQPASRRRRRAAQSEGAPSTASEAFAGGRAALARGDSTRAALLLGIAMRLAPEFADDVLRAVSGRDDQPLLALVRGDALRLLGREAEALEAFDRARGRAAVPEPAKPRAPEAGPGLFDDEGDEG